MFIGLHVYMFTYLYVYMFTAFITLIKYGDAGSSVFVDVSERVDGDSLGVSLLHRSERLSCDKLGNFLEASLYIQ